MSLADVTSARSSPAPDACPECDTSASVTSDLHKYQVACTCKPGSAQYACADDPGPPPPAKTDTPPALPPRPPVSVLATNRRNNASVGCPTGESPCRRRKYAWWCVGCGALSAALGGLLAAQHILLRAYTSSPQHLETVPCAIPATMLVLTGVCIMSLARRRNRYSYMIKVVGACCLVCALTCVLVTITTTVIHMNKLQTLKFCEYTKLTRTCTCFSMPPDSQHTGTDDDGIRCAFEGVSDCGVVHGALYWCLRGVFALSVSAVLVCIFSTMLQYQLLSHERKKMYWEQLELRCRSLYRPPSNHGTQAAPAQPQSTCSCCAQCHPAQPAWDISLQHRFWAPGRIGNLYSPNPGTVRKTSAWSWFPWPRSNSQNSRCRMGGVPQSGDSAYGFCENDQPNQNPGQTYDERSYPNFQFQRGNQSSFAQSSGNFGQNSGSFVQGSGNFGQNSGSFVPNSALAQSGQFVFGESSGSYDAQTGVWGPPPPYSPQGRSNSRHHLHQDPAAATLLHHHHVDRNSMQNMHEHTNIQTHTCPRNSYLMQHQQAQERVNQEIRMNPELARMNPELARMNPELARLNPEMARMNPELARMNPELARMNPELARLNPELGRLNPELARLNPDLSMMNRDLARINSELARLNPELGSLAQMYPKDVSELVRLAELGQLGQLALPQEQRFNTLRGHLVPYPCQRSLGMSAGNLHRDCRMEETAAIECVHQKSASKVSDQSTESCQKQGKENLGFQNDKHSPMRASMQDCHRAVNQNAESEVYFADVSSCCNVSVKADCCMNPNVSALVGTIENHPESTSESDTGSFTLTRQQRPQPQVGSKRRPRQKPRQDPNNSMRLTEQIELNCHRDRMDRSERMCEGRMSERMNESRISERMNESRMSERMNDKARAGSRDRLNDRCDSRDRLNDRSDCRIDRMNESRHSDRMNETGISDRMNDTRMSERFNESKLSDRMSESRISERLNDTRLSDRKNDFRMSERTTLNISPIRLPKTSPKSLDVQKDRQFDHPRQSSSDSNKADFFIPPPPAISPLSPNTEESLLSEDDERQYTNKPETSKCLGPDSQYEKEEKEVLKTSHHHCYSDTNTMDSGWQSGSEKQVTD